MYGVLAELAHCYSTRKGCHHVLQVCNKSPQRASQAGSNNHSQEVSQAPRTGTRALVVTVTLDDTRLK